MRIRAHAVFFAFFVAIVPASFAFAFDVYVKTNYRNQPDLSQYGAKDLVNVQGGVAAALV